MIKLKYHWISELFCQPEPEPARHRKPGGPRKLVWAQVCEIRRRAPSTSQKTLAAEFGISPSQVSKIVRMRTWTSPPPDEAADDLGQWRCVS